MMGDFRATNFRGLVAPLLYQDFSEKNSMHFGNLNEAQFTLFWKCWENNLRVINDIIPIILRNITYGPPMKVFMYGILKAGTWAIMRYLRGLCRIYSTVGCLKILLKNMQEVDLSLRQTIQNNYI